MMTMDRLSSLGGFDALSTIGDSLRIALNAVLEDLDGFGSLEAIGGSLVIVDNPSLSTCLGTALADSVGEQGVVEEIVISGNEGECGDAPSTPASARPVGSACEVATECAGEVPLCLREYRPVRDLIFPDAEPSIAAPYEDIGLDFPGGYCSSEVNCAADSDCPAGGSCFVPFENVTPETLDELALMNFPFDIHAFSDLGLCLEACSDPTQCRDGYTCDIPISELLSLVPGASQETYCIAPPATGVCLDNPCINGGICTNAADEDFICDCPPGFVGTHCETPTEVEVGQPDPTETTDDESPCQANPCRHEGVCTDIGDSYECTCAPGFVGHDCDARVDCGAPPEAPHANAWIATTTYESQVYYTCADGFRDMSASEEGLTCTADGQWEGTLPTCTIIECEPPPAAAGASLSFDATSYQSLAVYQCDEGWLMSPIDGAIRYCNENGEWSGVTPICTLIDCGTPLSLENGSSSYDATTYGGEVSYTCEVGYVILPVQGATQSCRSDGEWHGPTAICNPVDCGTPSGATNGSVAFTSTGYDDAATYQCNTGFVMGAAESGQRVCLANGYWSGSAPLCSPLGDCEPGYIRVDGVCEDIDECLAGGSSCDPLVTCDNTEGSFICGACPAGYDDIFGNATQCTDIDECSLGLDACSPTVECINTAGGYSCGVCPSGYTDLYDDGTVCDDVDECMDGTDDCDNLATCNNSPGSYSCGPCPLGYDDIYLDGTLCEDTDECISGLNDCDAVASCTNVVGSYECACPAEWTDTLGDGTSCEEPFSGCEYHILTYEVTGVFRISGTTFGMGDGSHVIPNAADPTHKGTLELWVSDDGNGNPGDGEAGVLYYSMDQVFSTTTSGLTVDTNTNGSAGYASNTTRINSGSLTGTTLTWGSCSTSGSGNNWTPDDAASGPGCLPDYHSTGNVECIDNSAFANCSTGGLQDGNNPQDEMWSQPLSAFSFGPDLSSFDMGEAPIPNRSPSTTHMQMSGTLVGTPTCVQP